MPKFSISLLTTEEMSDEKLTQLYETAKKEHKDFPYEDLDIIFKVAKANRHFFPSINIAGTDNKPEVYMVRWVGAYRNGIQNIPSERKALPRSTCSDPIISTIVKVAKGLKEEEIKAAEINHILFMSAENVQGGLLEEYIASQVKAYGWLWCAGQVLRAIDFCNSDGSLCLQIKNKYNSENSSSSSIREGTPIQKWYRLDKEDQDGKIYPKYMWAKLNDIINTHKTKNTDAAGKELPKCCMSEEAYVQFVKQAISRNNDIISGE